jgi:signal transduction histidine kinase
LVYAVFLIALIAFRGITGALPEAHWQNQPMIMTTAEASSSLAGGDYELVPDGLLLYHSPNEGYVIVSSENIGLRSGTTFSGYNNYAFWSFILILVLVIVVNGLLTRFVFRGIMNPIKILTDGVHEIRDGNLSFRIEYAGKDEFAPISNDFNEMAVKLGEMVEQKQRDEMARRELIAGISHDLRTPLTSIKAYLEGLEKGVASTPQMEKKYLDTIRNKAKNMEHIVNQLYAFSRLDIGEFPIKREQIDIVGLLKEIVNDTSQATCETGMEVNYSGEENPVNCMVDAIQFENVINNILGNSYKYKVDEIVHVQVACTMRGTNAEVTISDDGPGVSEDSLGKIFDIFYREDVSRYRSEDGSGIGLSIAQKLIEQFDGSIRAENLLAGGLRTTIILPLCLEENGDNHG